MAPQFSQAHRQNSAPISAAYPPHSQVSPAQPNPVRPKKTKFPICFRASRRQNTYRRTGILPVSIFVFKFRYLHPHADEGGLTPFAVKRIRVNSWDSCQNGPHSCPFVPDGVGERWRTHFSHKKPGPKPIKLELTALLDAPIAATA